MADTKRYKGMRYLLEVILDRVVGGVVEVLLYRDRDRRNRPRLHCLE